MVFWFWKVGKILFLVFEGQGNLSNAINLSKAKKKMNLYSPPNLPKTKKE
jgi:hypothetical protein